MIAVWLKKEKCNMESYHFDW